MNVFHSLTAALRIRQMLAVLMLATALLAIPAFAPDDASALRRSERTISRACSGAGGSIHYDFESGDFSSYSMTCTLPSGAQFTCTSSDGPFGNMVDC